MKERTLKDLVEEINVLIKQADKYSIDIDPEVVKDILRKYEEQLWLEEIEA
jgi:hypothetical protein